MENIFSALLKTVWDVRYACFMFSFRVGDFIARSKTKVVLYRLFHEKKVGVLGDDINSRCEKKFILTYIKF
jgi:hypothetical protein